MKTYRITNRVSAAARKAIENCLEMHDRYRGAYFHNPDGSASGRRRAERHFALMHPEFCLIDGERKITVMPDYSQSCRNVYYKLIIRVDEGEDTTWANVRLLKKIIGA